MDDWKDDDNKYYNDNIDDDNINDYNKLYVETEDDDDEDGISLESENDILKVLDPDLVEYFNEARLIKRKLPNDKNKKKKDKIIYEVGQIVLFKNKKHTILYGPYDQNGKDMYELETENGNVICAEYKQINIEK